MTIHTSCPIPTHCELVLMVLEEVEVDVEVEVEMLDMVDVVVGVAIVISSALPNLSTRSSIEPSERSVGSSIVAGGM